MKNVGGSNGGLVQTLERGGKGYILIRSRDRGDFEAQEPRPRQGSKSKEKHRGSKGMHRESKEMHRESKGMQRKSKEIHRKSEENALEA